MTDREQAEELCREYNKTLKAYLDGIISLDDALDTSAILRSKLKRLGFYFRGKNPNHLEVTIVRLRQTLNVNV